MRRQFTLLLFSTLYFCIVCSSHAANLDSMVLNSHDFYQRFPSQDPLAEQLDAIIYSPPIPIRIDQKTPVRIALLLSGNANSLTNTSMLLAFKKRMKELRVEYQLDTYPDVVDSYVKLANNPPDYVVVTQLGLLQSRYLERFLRSRAPKVILYDFTTPLTNWFNHSPLLYVGFDQVKATKMFASYLNRQLAVDARLSAVVLPSGYLNQVRCNIFLDEMTRYKRPITIIKTASDDKNSALKIAQDLLKESPPDFIFSCSHNISEGVVSALKDHRSATNIQTNGWGISVSDIENLERGYLMASVLFNGDDLSIALAEVIKLDLEGKNTPILYVAQSFLMPANLGFESLQLMYQRAYRYSGVLWRK